MFPITTPFYISHYVTLLLRHAFSPLFSFLSLLTASGCKCPACMNTVWGWSYYPKGCACSRLPRRSSSAWRPWSSSASVSHPGPWVMTRMSTQHVKYNCNRVQPYFRELMGWIKSVRVTVVFWLCGHSASAGPEEPELLWQTADLLHQGARPFGQPPRRDHPHAETVSAHAAAGLPPVGNTHNRIPKKCTMLWHWTWMHMSFFFLEWVQNNAPSSHTKWKTQHYTGLQYNCKPILNTQARFVLF